MEKTVKLKYIDMRYTTIYGGSYDYDDAPMGFAIDLKNILNSIKYRSIIKFTCSQSIIYLFEKVDGFVKYDKPSEYYGRYKGGEVMVDNSISLYDNDFTIEYVEVVG